MAEWDSKQKAAFTKAMGKRQRFARGGKVKRKKFAQGSTVLGGPSGGGTSENATNPNSGLLGTMNQIVGLNNNYRANAANIQQGTNAAQLNQAYTGVQGSLENQGNLVNTLTPQASTAVGNQNFLADQYGAMARGEGPNPAQNQLNEATQKNVANQAAMMAGQRGSSANAGLMARQAAQQGAATQQTAVGQAATLGAQQQIAAQNNLANLANNQISQTGQAITGQGSAQQNEQAILQNANTSYNNAAVGMQSNINNVNSQTAAANQNMAANTMGGISSAISAPMSALAKGGEVESHVKLAEMNAHSLGIHKKHYDDGGEVDAPNLGSFKAGEDSASAPNVASTAALPADNTSFSSSVNKPSSVMGGGSGGGGGGMSSMMSMAALAADGGMIEKNPLLSPQSQIVGPGKMAAAYFNPGSSSNGPNVPGTSALPQNKESFSKDVKEAMAKKPGDKGSPDQTNEQAKEGYMDADAKLGVSGVDNEEDMMPASNNDSYDMQAVAKGGAIHEGHVHEYFKGGGKVKAMVSPGEIWLTPEKVQKVIQEGVDPKSIGEKIKGKAKVKGDSYANDTVPRDLEEGGVVIDRKNVGTREKRELFVHRAIARKKARR